MAQASRPAFSDLDAERDRNESPRTWESKLRGFPLQYEYDLLEDANAQIRLLRFAPSTNQSHLSFEVSCWSVEQAPQYYAISYTWGDDDLLPGLFIDDKILYVRQNCHHALWQVTLHYPETFIWVDSICINQNNTTEKSAQVAMMDGIYKAASIVLICLGPHSNNSELLLQYEQDLETLVEPVKSLPPLRRSILPPLQRSNWSDELWEDWTSMRGDDFITRARDKRCDFRFQV